MGLKALMEYDFFGATGFELRPTREVMQAGFDMVSGKLGSFRIRSNRRQRMINRATRLG